MRGEKVITINNNTQIICQAGDTVDSVKGIAPVKVTGRLTINQNGLNRLATTVVTPKLAKSIDEVRLRSILDFSNEANEVIGLPATDCLIVRTASEFGGKSQPALLVKNLLGEIGYKVLGNQPANSIHCIEQFVAEAAMPDSFLMIHDDNYRYQTKGVHIRTMETNTGAELFGGTGVLQMRELERAGAAYVRVNIQDTEVMSHYKLEKLFDYGTAEVEMSNIDQTSGEFILQQIQKAKEEIIGAHEAGQELKGTNSVVESRIYPQLRGGIGRRLQVLDID